MAINRPDRPYPRAAAALWLAGALAFGCGTGGRTRDRGPAVVESDFVVRWNVDGRDTVAVCEDIAVETWAVEARRGEFIETVEVDCAGGFTTADLFSELAPGSYTVTVIAFGPNRREVGRSFREVNFDGSETIVEVPLYTSIDIFWNINGTLDGTALGTSWDTCAEVEAAVASITVDDGDPIEAECDLDGNMGVSLTDLPVGLHTVRVKLQDAAGHDLTTEAAATFASGEAGAEFVIDFFWDSFFEPKRSNVIGSYWFQALFEGTGCDSTDPPVGNQLALLTLDGEVVDAPICDDDTVVAPAGCPLANGAELYACTDRDQAIPDLLWGPYKLVLQGTVPIGPQEDEICWETVGPNGPEIEILVGAGFDNPVEVIDLDRFSTAGACRPL